MKIVSVGGSTGEIRQMRAVITVPAGPKEDVDTWVRECLAWCDSEAIPVAHTLIGHGWHAAIEMVTSGEAEIIVVARESHLEPDRVPQLRIVELERAKKEQRRRGLRRPRIINR